MILIPGVVFLADARRACLVFSFRLQPGDQVVGGFLAGENDCLQFRVVEISSLPGNPVEVLTLAADIANTGNPEFPWLPTSTRSAGSSLRFRLSVASFT
jgi:hypothetical protein